MRFQTVSHFTFEGRKKKKKKAKSKQRKNRLNGFSCLCGSDTLISRANFFHSLSLHSQCSISIRIWQRAGKKCEQLAFCLRKYFIMQYITMDSEFMSIVIITMLFLYLYLYVLIFESIEFYISLSFFGYLKYITCRCTLFLLPFPLRLCVLLCAHSWKRK